MKIDVYVDKLKQYKALLENKDKILFPAVNATLATMLDRIFKDGEDVNNNLFGLYSTKAMYIKVPYQGVKNSSLKKIGKKDDNTLDNSNIFDNTANVYIHDMIDSNTSDFYKTNDFMGLKNKTYDVICSPFKLKEKKD